MARVRHPGGALAALVLFMRAQSRQQGRLFDWFTKKMNGSLDRLCDATEEHTEAIRELKDEMRRKQ